LFPIDFQTLGIYWFSKVFQILLFPLIPFVQTRQKRYGMWNGPKTPFGRKVFPVMVAIELKDLCGPSVNKGFFDFLANFDLLKASFHKWLRLYEFCWLKAFLHSKCYK